MGKKLELVGKKFNKLFVISEVEERTRSGKVKYSCVCDCGNVVDVIGSKLVNGWTKSCSCEQKRIATIAGKKTYNIKHGVSNHSLYQTYISMINRCYNKKCKSYYRYGSRGIVVCNAWRGEKGFKNFINDMGDKPSEGHSLDRINNNAEYSKENCRWATRIEQENNKSTNRIISFNNTNYTIAELARLLDIKYVTLYSKLRRYNFICDEKFNNRN